jgi:hypothetical protein
VGDCRLLNMFFRYCTRFDFNVRVLEQLAMKLKKLTVSSICDIILRIINNAIMVSTRIMHVG